MESVHAHGHEFHCNGSSSVVSGTFSYDDLTYTVVFTPTQSIENSIYTVSASDLKDSGGDTQQDPFSSTCEVGISYRLYMPVIFKDWTP